MEVVTSMAPWLSKLPRINRPPPLPSFTSISPVLIRVPLGNTRLEATAASLLSRRRVPALASPPVQVSTASVLVVPLTQTVWPAATLPLRVQRPRSLKLAVPVAPGAMFNTALRLITSLPETSPPLKLKLLPVRLAVLPRNIRLPPTARLPPFWLNTWLPPLMVRL